MSEIWIVQTKIQHYRMPLFKKLAEHIVPEDKLCILGHTENVVPFEGDKGLIIKSCALKKVFNIYYWEGLVWLVLVSKPKYLVITASPRNLSSWFLVFVRKIQGLPIVGWSKVFSDNPESNNYFSHRIRELYYLLFSSMIVYGDGSMRELISLGYNKNKIIVANNTIDTDYVIKSEAIICSHADKIIEQYGLKNQKIILYIGRLDPEKFFFDLLLAWNNLKSLDPEYVLIFVGSGSGFNELKSRISSLNTSRIKVVGRVPQYIDYSWIYLADVLVLPGQVGLSVQQGMILGTPVVIADGKGVDAEMITHGFSGWRYEKNNVTELSKIVHYVLSSDVSEVTNNARELVLSNYSLDNMCNKIGAIFRSS